ncbi:hypothetical protein REPUB_Repub05bG0012400 [Reevesia pubescens]
MEKLMESQSSNSLRKPIRGRSHTRKIAQGGKSAVFHRIPSPNDNTFFQKPSGRYCNGKLIIDFIGQLSWSIIWTTLVRQAALKTNDLAGDGTITSVVLA